MPGICPRCSKNVYFAEEKQALGKSWHKLCFVCANCKKMLDSGNLTEHDGNMFCTTCYRKNFGPKGYGFGGGAGCLSMDNGTDFTAKTNHVDHQAEAYIAPRRVAMSETSGNPNCPVESKASVAVKKTSNPRWGGAEICPRCEKSVYLAELMRGAGKAWHKGCFTCFHCNKRVDSTTLCEREGEIYCKPCYGRNYGPKGFGFGIGAGTLQMS